MPSIRHRRPAGCRTVRVRDSKDVNRPGLAVGSQAWGAFVEFAAGRIG
ncbi:DUF397 domain-containing protein [Streptomyces sp. NPDC005009]